jgi:uracil-DNA glycosylase
MFVGQDWGCDGSLPDLVADKDADIKSGTGKNLHDLLNKAEIPLEECFFTNALFGVREGKENTGTSPGWKDPKFVGDCAEALKAQIAAVRPRGIICLGRDAPVLLAGLMSECAPWKKAESFKEIDSNGHTVVSVTSLPGIDVAAILLHPSFRWVNLRHRSYRGLVKQEAELKILADVWSKVSSEPAS